MFVECIVAHTNNPPTHAPAAPRGRSGIAPVPMTRQSVTRPGLAGDEEAGSPARPSPQLHPLCGLPAAAVPLEAA